MTFTPQQRRHKLLAQINLFGEFPLVWSVATTNYFTDVSISTWCIRHSVRFEMEVYERTIKALGNWTFINFIKIKDSEL